MVDPVKNPTSAPTPTKAANPSAKASEPLSSTPFVLFGQLRRDVMVLGKFNFEADAETAAETAVKEGRAQEAFVVPTLSYFTASGRNWQATDFGIAHEASRGVPLNPNAGEQEAQDDPNAQPAESISGNIKANIEAQQAASGDEGSKLVEKPKEGA